MTLQNELYNIENCQVNNFEISINNVRKAKKLKEEY